MSLEEKVIELTQEEHDIEVVSYGMQILGDGIKTILIIIILGILVGHLVESVIYLGFSLLGTCIMGGYHCKTQGRCLLCTVLLWGIMLYLSATLQMSSVSSFLKYILCVILLIVLFLAPAQNVNKLLSKKVYMANRRYSVCFCFGITVTIMLLMDKYPQTAMLLLINYVEIVVSMIFGKGVYWYVKGKDGQTGGKSSRKDGCSYC